MTYGDVFHPVLCGLVNEFCLSSDDYDDCAALEWDWRTESQSLYHYLKNFVVFPDTVQSFEIVSEEIDEQKMNMNVLVNEKTSLL
mmetsp:Transcript_11260/g.20351  ORF Transcript_11260/g.20351 Transcript_11260/m.20351 type:complete len:85 (-) Transcript_11260:500-754(-)